MADRVNTKFVFILVAVLVLIASAVGVLAFAARPTAEKYIQQANAFMDEGRTATAIEYFGRALKKRSGDIQLLEQYLDALEQVRTGDSRLASNYIRKMIAALEQLMTHDPDNPQHFERLMQFYLKLGRDLRDTNSWGRMLERASTILESNPEMVQAHKYRGIALVNRMGILDIPAQDRQQARQDLLLSLERNPNDREALNHLAQWYILEARVLQQPGGDMDLVEEYRQEADRLSTQSLEVGPDDPGRQLDRVVILAFLNRRDSDEFRDLVDLLEARILEDPSVPSFIVLQCATYLTLADPQRAEQPDAPDLQDQEAPVGQDDMKWRFQRAEHLLRAAVGHHPENLQLSSALGNVLKFSGRPQEAMQLFKQVFEADVSADILTAFRLAPLQASATIEYVGMLIGQTDEMDPTPREEALSEAEALLNRVSADFGESEMVNLQLGRLAIKRKQWKEASVRLEKANNQFRPSNPMAPVALQLSAMVWQQLGQSGTAIERMEQLVKIRPRYTRGRHELARMYMRLSEMDQARRHLDVIARLEPDQPRTQRLEADWLAREGNLDQAIELYESMDPTANPELIPPLAKLYIANGQQDAARQVLEQRFEQDPTDVSTLSRLVPLVDDPSQALAYLETSRQAGVDADVLKLLERNIQGDNRQELIEDVIERQQDPVRRHLSRFSLYSQQDMTEQAKQELEAAAQINPDHPLVVQTQFRMALADKDWQQAEKLVERSVALNLDAADGAFYWGRLAMTRGQLDRAIEFFHNGLNARPVYSDGWKMLGLAQQQKGLISDAVASYERSLEQKPNNVSALRALAQIQDAQRRHSQALESLRKAVRFARSDRRLAAQYLAYEEKHGDVEHALEIRQQIAEANPQDHANRRALALALARLGRMDEAEAMIQALMAEDTVDRNTIATAAKIRHLAGEPDAGREMMIAYVHGQGDQASDADWLLFATYLLETDQDNQALAAFRQAIELEDPSTRRATRMLADLLFDRREFEQAVQYYEQLWETASDDRRVAQRFVEALIQAQKLQRAEQVLSQVVQFHGADERTCLLESAIAQAHGDMQGALDALNRAEEFAPKLAVVYLRRAEVQLGSPEHETEVMDDLARAIELDPDLNPARRMLATMYARQGDIRRAISELRVLIERDPRDKLARVQLVGLYAHSGQSTPRRSLLKESTGLFPDDVNWLRLQAEQAMEEDDFELAIVKLLEAIQIKPTAKNLIVLIDLLLNSGQTDTAMSVMRQQREVVRRIPILLAQRGRALAAMGQDDHARASFETAIQGCKTFPQIYAIRHQIVEAWGMDQATSFFGEQAHGENEGLVKLAIAELLTRSKKHEQAIKQLDTLDSQIATDSPYYLEYYQLRALTLYELGRYDDALAVFENALSQKPNDVMMLNNLAYLLTENLQRPEEAVELARKAATLAPNNSLVLDTLGWSLFRAGETAPALTALERSVSIRATATNCLHLGEALLNRAEYDGAISLFQQAKRLAEQAKDEKTHQAAIQRLEEINNPESEGVQ